MFINRLNQLYKPKRILYYYIKAEKEDISSFCKGENEEKFDQILTYANAFGTYDRPGLFYLNGFKNPVIGVEFRPEDKRISYPTDLKSVVLDEAFYYSVEVENDFETDLDSVQKLFKEIAKDDDAHRQYNHLSISETPAVISLFPHNEKLRILYEWKVVADCAKNVIFDDADSFDKEALYQMSFHDPITGHYNWNHLVPILEMPVDANISDYAFAHFDIKEFRVINEVYGHIAANRVLSNVVSAMNEADFVYASGRCHNDNFAIVLKDMPTEELKACLTDFFAKLSVLEEDPNYKIYFRCGVVPMPLSLLSGNRVADAAKMAQKMGVNSNQTDIIIYTEKMHDDILWSNYIKAYLDTAILNDEFEVYLQPKFDSVKEKIKGAEALIRWNYKKREMLSPYRFVPFFEKDGSIGKLDDIVLTKVCEAFKKWKETGRPLYPVSVNLSRQRLYDTGLVKHLESVVDAYGVDHGLIDFELTESASYENMERMLCVLQDLREAGFSISMDDFGTGYSSLSLLTELPMDTLKIDKSFVDRIGTGADKEKDITVIRHIISLAKELGFTCLAEGAEEKSQVDVLRDLGCEIIQGYYYSKPIPMVDYENTYLKG